MSACPACAAPHTAGTSCQRCGVDLDVARALDAVGRVCFNRALELIAEGQRERAEDQLCAACALMPARVEARRALGKLRAQLGRLDAAAVDLELARRLAPDDPGTRRAAEAVRRRLARERWWVVGIAVLLAVTTVVTLMSAGLSWSEG